MKSFTTVFAIALLPALISAAPAQNNNYQSDSRNTYQSDSRNTVSKATPTLFDFTSTYAAYATPDQVVNSNSTPTPGEPGAYGFFSYGINAPQEVICYNITVFISGNYSSAAKTSTHIHQGVKGRSGPPRLAFPNPTVTSPIDVFGRRVSIGCLTAPFTTGILVNGTDTGTNFSLSQIEANPPMFFTDVHTSKFLAGAIRGQLDLTGTVY
ncbi:hypothetical protein RQP46_009747 [Phenoliferia psychrophenolica]